MVHHAARDGFNTDASRYDLGRPAYPSAAVDLLVLSCGLSDGSSVLDVGAGTGALTLPLVKRGLSVWSLEPVEAMRSALASRLPHATAIDGTAEAVPFGDATFEAVVVGQAFHWFDGPAALLEFARVLRPGGAVGLVWNVRDKEDPIQRALDVIFDAHAGDTPRHRREQWRSAFTEDAPFVQPVKQETSFVQTLDREGLHARVFSVSFMATLEGDALSSAARATDELFDQFAIDGQVALAYRCEVWTTRLR